MSYIDDMVDDVKSLNADKLLFKAEKIVCVNESNHNKGFNYQKTFYVILIIFVLLVIISKIVYGAT